jgi:hypothetical protein
MTLTTMCVGDGLRADLLLNVNPFPSIPDSPEIVAPHLRSIIETRGAWGICECWAGQLEGQLLTTDIFSAYARADGKSAGTCRTHWYLLHSVRQLTCVNTNGIQAGCTKTCRQLPRSVASQLSKRQANSDNANQ